MVIRKDRKGTWIVTEDETDSSLISVKDERTGESKVVNTSSLLLIRPIDLHHRFKVIDGVLWDFKENQPLHIIPSWEGTTKMKRLCNLLNEIDEETELNK